MWQKSRLVGQNGLPFTRYTLNTRQPWLRRLSQLVNVLRGVMSLVGPQAQPAAVVNRYGDAERRRLAERPERRGLRGQGGELDSAEQAQLELRYLENYSLRQDLSILARSLRSHSTRSIPDRSDPPDRNPEQEKP